MNTKLESVLEIFDLLSDISSLRREVEKLEKKRTQLISITKMLEEERNEAEVKKHKANHNLLQIKQELLEITEAGEMIYESINDTAAKLTQIEDAKSLLPKLKEALEKAEKAETFNTVPF